ncbi:hypothetical protein BaRGS_00006277 [Batillaria attramentaria]|uniref:Uncharacterized protein n=1 Tax=Batillaria attramentaria TaxID=370345 RepID=A0ABD0LRK6_9CAEN
MRGGKKPTQSAVLMGDRKACAVCANAFSEEELFLCRRTGCYDNDMNTTVCAGNLATSPITESPPLHNSNKRWDLYELEVFIVIVLDSKRQMHSSGCTLRV